VRRTASLCGVVLAAVVAQVGLAPAAQAAPLCDGKVATVVGTRGGDVLTGTRGDDVLVGRDGQDRIDARGGDDVVCGGPGADRLTGGPGDDRLFGGTGLPGGDDAGMVFLPDRLVGGPGDDRLAGQVSDREFRLGVRDLIDYSGTPRGIAVDLTLGTVTGAGNDTVVGRRLLLVATAHDDVVVGSPEADSMVLGRGADLVRAGRGGDEVSTGTGRDEVRGGGGHDTLFSGGGADVVRAGRGDDEVKDTGARGADDLAAGSGDDTVTDHFLSLDGQAYAGGTGEGDLLTLEADIEEGEYDGSWDMSSGTLAMAGPVPFDARATGLEWVDLPDGAGFEVTGTAADERVIANGPYVRFFAQGGDDVLVGTSGDDLYDGGPGTDSTPFIGLGDDNCISVERFTEEAAASDCETRRP